MSNKEPPDGGGGDTGESPSKISAICSPPLFSEEMDTSVSVSPLKRPAASTSNNSGSKKFTRPSDSIQNTYINPLFEGDSPFTYTDNDQGPFIVHISRTEPDLTSGFSLRVLRMAQNLHQNKVPDIVVGGIKAVGRNKVCVEFKSAASANSFISSKCLGEQYLTQIPKFHISRMGVLRGIPTDWTLEQLIGGLSYPDNCGPVIKARRLNKKIIKDGVTQWIPTTAVVVTFQGQLLPQRVYCFQSSILVETYQLPTLQCRNCCRFGHVADQCRSHPRCFRCAQNHPGSSCEVPDDSVSCLLCLGRHKATDINCPEHSRQKSIKIVMSEENISFSEASQRFRPSRPTYAEKAATISSPIHPEIPHSLPSTPARPSPIHPSTPSSSYRK